jgi:DNA-binding NarL/FixJ family response regulator
MEQKRALALEGDCVAKITVLLADDSEDIRTEVRAELDSEFNIVGTAENGEEAIDAVTCLDPDVIVIDIGMPVLNGIMASSRIREGNPRIKIVFMSIHEQPEYISAAFGAGASGYVTKRRLATDLAPAIRQVIQGHTFLSPSLHK